jgi:hypothetical protein
MMGMAALGACGPLASNESDAGSEGNDPPTDTEGSEDSGSGGSTAPTMTSASSGSSASSSSTGDGSHDTDYPVEPGCDEGDEGYEEYDSDSDGGTSSGGVEDTGIGMTGDFPLSATVYEIRMGGVPGGELVELTSVVVIAPPVLAADGAKTQLFVQEREGGAYSGINILIEFSNAEVDALAPGDLVNVRGDFIERYVFATIDVYDAEAAFDFVGTHPLPVPMIVDPAMVSAGGELAESLESVLVEVEQAQVIDPTACPGEVLVQAQLKVDDRYLAADGIALPAPASGIYTRIAGPLIYTYNGFEIAPRSLADLGL